MEFCRINDLSNELLALTVRRQIFSKVRMKLDVGNLKVFEELARASFGIKMADGQLATQRLQFFH